MHRREAPYAAAFLTFVGGGFILLGGLFMALLKLALFLAHVPHPFPGVVGIAIALLLWLMGLLMILLPHGRIAWGIATILLAILSLPYAALGGFIIGFILAAFGGLLAILHRPWRRMRSGPVLFSPPSA